MAGGNYGPPPKQPIARGAKGRSAFLNNQAAINESLQREYNKDKGAYLKKTPPMGVGAKGKLAAKGRYFPVADSFYGAGPIQGPRRTGR